MPLMYWERRLSLGYSMTGTSESFPAWTVASTFT